MNTLAPELAEELKQRPPPSPPSLSEEELSGDKLVATVSQFRAGRAANLAGLRHLYPIPGPIPALVTETEHLVKVRDGADIRVLIYTPTKAPATGSPLIVMFHEGGWCMGDLTDEALNCRMFSRDLGAVCVNVEYRLAPEHPFPTGILDSWDVVKWCTREASPSSPLLPADPKLGFIVGGGSAGGNFAAVLCQLARDEGLQPPLTGQYLCVPALLDQHAIPEKWKSQYRSRPAGSVSDPIINVKMIALVHHVIKGDPCSPFYSPLLHENLGGLPPAFFQLCGLDPLKDEGMLYEKVLREEHGTKTRLEVYEGYGHMFWANWPLLKRSKEFFNDTLAGVKWLLEVGRPEPSGG